MSGPAGPTIDALVGLLGEVMGDDAPAPGSVHAGTRLAEDLEMESLEFVVFAEKVKERYGDRVDFVTWLSGKTLDEILQLRLGDLADHIDASLAAAGRDDPGGPADRNGSDETGGPGATRG